MDWFLDLSQPSTVVGIRHEIGSYLRRHAKDSGGIDEAELAVSELLGNVARHAPGPAWASLIWAQEHPLFTVWDLGPGFTLGPRPPSNLTAESGRGLFLVSAMVGELAAAARESGGMRVSVELPVSRLASVSHDPPRHNENVLPMLDEAEPGVGFGKESFLRALIVQLAQTIEVEHGPAAAEAAVAQVGSDVGGQMEAEFRAARKVVGRLAPQQIAECAVRLKHAINGEFFVMELSEDRIVLGNTRCPFGEAVQHAPALCRMTSSVFGGIAARNVDRQASVVLEERIAVGDPGCRVVLYLDREADDPRVAHRYLTPGQ